MIPSIAARCITNSSGRRKACKPTSAASGTSAAASAPIRDRPTANPVANTATIITSIGGGSRSKRASRPLAAAAALPAIRSRRPPRA